MRSGHRLSTWKRLLVSLLPAILLLTGAEVGVRVAGLAQPGLQTLPLPEEAAGLFISDPDLFWRLRPNLDTTFEGAKVESNTLGLRSPEVTRKAVREFRILSLGESTTFGLGVSNDQTYTALIADLLQREMPSLHFTAFNAGVSAWSSFQSLKYLELHGLALEPDLVLFYHELNDYLPSTLRDSSNTEIGARKTDRELYSSRVHSLSRWLVHTSAFYRYVSMRYALWSVEAFQRQDFDNPVLEIGLPDADIRPRLTRVEKARKTRLDLNEKSLGRRVSDAERLRNLTELRELCLSHRISLLVIHPAYRGTTPHECLLTRFCRDNGVMTYEAYSALHPPGLPPDACFRDAWHPNAEGHRRLAMGLADFIDRAAPWGAVADLR